MRGVKRKMMAFRVPEVLAEEFAAAAGAQFKSMTTLLVELMNGAVKAHRDEMIKAGQASQKLKIIEQRAKPQPDLPALVSPLGRYSQQSKVVLERLEKVGAVIPPKYRGALEGSIAANTDMMDALDALYLESAGDDALEAEYDAFQSAVMGVLNDQDN